MFSRFLAWAKDHPIWLGVGVFAVGIALLWLFGFFGRKQVAGSTNNAASYYAAEAAANQAAAAQEINRENTLVQVGGIQAQRDVEIAKVEGQTEIARQLATVQMYGFDVNRDIELARTGATADVANTSSANALTAALRQFDFLSHAADAHLSETYSNNAAAQNIEALHANANENIAIATASFDREARAQEAMYTYFGLRDKYQEAAHLDDTNIALERTRTTLTLASEAQTALHGTAGIYGVWTPETGQITIANTSIGGPIDPATIAQMATYPWLRPAV